MGVEVESDAPEDDPRERTRTVAVSHDHERDHDQRPCPLDPMMGHDRTRWVGDYLFVPRAWMVRSMDCAWIAPGSVGTLAGR